MKKVFGGVVVLFMAMTFPGMGATQEKINLSGEVTKIEGKSFPYSVSIKDSIGEVHTVLIDSNTKKSGEIKVGAKVAGEITSTGHALSILVLEGSKPPPPQHAPGGCPEGPPCPEPKPK